MTIESTALARPDRWVPDPHAPVLAQFCCEKQQTIHVVVTSHARLCTTTSVISC